MHYTKLIFRKGDINRFRAAIFIKPGILNILDLSIFKIKKVKDKNMPFFESELKIINRCYYFYSPFRNPFFNNFCPDFLYFLYYIF